MPHTNSFEHPREPERLEALRDMQILDTPTEERFNRITRLVCNSLDVPICAISCIDLNRQWFKSIQGLEIVQTNRDISFCQHTILQDEVIVVPDARFDDRFANNPLVTSDPSIVFYAGAPIYARANLPVATLCVIDTQPRHFDPESCEMLRDFARIVEREMHAARRNPIEEAIVHQVGDSWRATMIDPLTRLWNHEGIGIIITEAIRTHEQDSPIGAAIVDLCGYDDVCKSMGYVQGDAYVRSFSRAALQLLDEGDAMGRLRGAEFAFQFADAQTCEDAEHKLRRLLELATQIMPTAATIEPIGFGMWFPEQVVQRPELILEHLSDGLENVRLVQNAQLEVRVHGDRFESRNAA